MNFTSFWFVLLLCGLILAQNDGYSTLTEENIETQSRCFPDMCDLLKDFGAMREKLGAMETRLKKSETRLTDSETKLKETEKRILEVKNKERTKVIFSAAAGQNGAVGPFSIHKTLIYGKVITNIGNAYSSHTGIFTAPVSGVYYFTIFYHAGGQHGAGLQLFKNSRVMVVTADHTSWIDTADNGGNAVFLQMQQGDQVYVRMDVNTHVWGGGYHTTFSGFLVTQM